MAEKIVLEVEFQTGDAKKRSVELTQELLKQRQELSDLTSQYKQGLISVEQYAEKSNDLRREIKANADEQRVLEKNIELTRKAQEANAGSLDQLTAQLTIAQKELNALEGTLQRNEDGTIELTEAYINAKAEVENARKALIDFGKGVNDGRANVGRYEEAINKAFGENTAFGKSFFDTAKILDTDFKEAFKNAKDTVNSFFTLIKTNPIAQFALIIGALVAALAGAVTSFLKTEEGSNQLAVVMERLKVIFNAILVPIQLAGKAIFAVADFASQAAASIADFFGAGANEAGERVKQLQEIEKQLIKIDSKNKKFLADIEAQKNIRDDESRSTQEAITANIKLGEIEAERFKILRTALERKVKLLEQELEATPKIQRTTEQLAKVEEARGELNDAIADSLGIQNEQIVNMVATLQAQVEVENELRSINVEKQILQGKVIKGSKEELDVRLKNAREQQKADLLVFTKGKELNDAQLQNLLKNNDRARLAYEKRELEILQLQKGFQDEQQANYEAFLSKQEQLRNNYLAQQAEREAKAEADRQKSENEEIARLQRLAIVAMENTAERVQAEKDLAEEQFNVRVRREQLAGEALLLARTELDQQLKAIDDGYLSYQEGLKDRQKAIEMQAFQEDLTLQTTLAEEQRARELEDLTLTTEEKLAIEESFLNTKLALIELEKQARLQAIADEKLVTEGDENLTDEEKLVRLAEIEAEKRAIIKDSQDEELAEFSRYNQARDAIQEASVQNQLAALEKLGGALGQLAGNFKEDTIAYKALATSEAVINTYLAATKALNAKDGTPGFVRIAQAIAVIATGLSSVAKITGVKLAQGGMIQLAGGGRVRGAGSTKGDRIPALLSNNEGVMVANAMTSDKTFVAKGTPKQIASSLNQTFGGRAFAEGGLVSSTDVINQSALSGSFDLNTQAFPAGDTFVSLTEFNEAQRNVKFTEELADR